MKPRKILPLLLASTLLASLEARALSPLTDDDRARSLYEQAQKLIARGEPAAALGKLETLVKHYRHGSLAAEAQLQVGNLLLANAEYEDAFEAYQVLIERFQASPLFKQAIEGQFKAARASVADYRRREQKEDSSKQGLPARDVIVEMFRILVKNGRYTSSAPDAQYELAVALDKLKLPEQAAAEHENFLKTYPSDARAADAAFQVANIPFREALRHNREAGLAERALLAFEYFIAAYPASERRPEAESRVRRIKELQRERMLEVARYYEHAGEKKAALIYYNEALKILPTESDPRIIEALDRLDTEGSTGPDLTSEPVEVGQ